MSTPTESPRTGSAQTPHGAQPTPPAGRPAPSARPALTRYRVSAYVVGVGLLVLVGVAMPLKYLGDQPGFSAVFSPIHGFLYMVYLACSLDLGTRLRWSIGRIIGVMLAGTVPFLSFVIEHRISRRAQAQIAATE